MIQLAGVTDYVISMGLGRRDVFVVVVVVVFIYFFYFKGGGGSM